MRFLCFIFFTCITFPACSQIQPQTVTIPEIGSSIYLQNSLLDSLNNSKRMINSGTGFIITNDGHIITCYHVVKGAREVQIALGSKIYAAQIIREDPLNDLALLKINGYFQALAFASEPLAEMGQDVFTIGYPNIELQGVNPKFTKGSISSLSGFQDDTRYYQISVPVQPGNSGGALLNEEGDIIAIVVSGLKAMASARTFVNIPQSVNYAIKAIYAKTMIELLPDISDNLIVSKHSKTSVIGRAAKSTVLVLCY